MSVSDNGSGLVPVPRRIQRKISPEEWLRVRLHYESADPKIALRPLADLYDIARQTLMIRAAKEHWQHQSKLVRQSTSELKQATSKAIEIAAQKTAETVSARVMDELAPWFEKEKRIHVKDAIRRSKRALIRLDDLAEADDPLDPKAEAFIAKSVDTYDTIKRRNLGMNDAGTGSGSLNLSILTNQALVQVKPES